MHRLLLLLLLAASARADLLQDPFPVGEGSRFQLQVDGVSADLVISITESSPGRVGVELFFTTAQTLAPVNLWQQFTLEYKSGSGVQMVAGYVYSPEMAAPEKVEQSQLRDMDGFSLRDFLFNDPKAVEKYKVGVETLTVPAGRIQATHYRQQRASHVIDYWISDEARPVGLVKLVQTEGSKSYTIVLAAKVKNLKRKIDPAMAKPLSKQGRSLLGPVVR